jgi:ribonucleoside-triphosphate reductase
MEIIKRDGRVVDFDINKIIKAIEKAFVEIDGYVDDTSKEICEKIAKDIESLNRDKFQVEDIQDMVEKQLMQSSRKDVAKAYIIYRNDRTRARQRKSRLQTEIGDKLFAKNV